MFSIDYLENQRLRAFHSAHNKYKQKIHDSKVRGLQVKMSFPDWYLWWFFNGVDKLQSTKHCSAQPCMCRKNDTGDYELDNIYLDTRGHNTSLANKIRFAPGYKKRDTPKLKKTRTLSRIGFRFGCSLITPLGKFDSASQVAEAYRITVGAAHNLIRLKAKSDWYWEKNLELV